MFSSSRSLVRACSLIVALVSMAAFAGCDGARSKGDEGTATIVAAIINVPADVSCIEVTVNGAQTSTQLFSVTPGQPATITFPGLTAGTATISERAFAVACSQVQPTTPPTWVSEMPVSVALVPGAISDVTVVLRRAGQVRITNDFQDGPALSFTLSPSSLTFGNVNVGASAIQTVTITNSGAAAAAVPARMISPGADPVPQFSLVTNGGAGTCPSMATVAPGASCTVQIAFAPTSAGAKSATLTLSGLTGSVALSGTGVASLAVFSFSVSTLAFPDTVVGSNSPAMTVTVTNTGTASGPFTQPTVTLGNDLVPQFNLPVGPGAGATCPGTNSLAAGASCTIVVQFIPTSAGTKTASLRLGMTSNPSVALSGTGLASQAVFSFSPSTLAFPDTVVGSNSPAMTVTVTNTGTASGAFTQPTVTLGNDLVAQFNLPVGPGAGATCPGTASLAPGASCTIVVQFIPTTVGAKTSSLRLGMMPNPSVALSGTGLASQAVFSFSTSSLTFPNTVVGSNSPAMTVTVTNTGTASGAFTQPTVTLGNDLVAQFNLPVGPGAGATCPGTASLAPGASCTIVVQFIPTTVGAKTSSLRLGMMPNPSVALSGTGLASQAVFSFSPSTLSFPDTVVGSNSPAMTVTVTNTGTASGAFTQPTVTLGNDLVAQFNLPVGPGAGATCPGTASLAPGASCTIVVQFIPTTVGAKTSSLRLGMMPNPSVALSGTGLASQAVFSFSPSTLSFPDTVVGSNSPAMTVTVTNTGTASGAFTQPTVTLGNDLVAQFNLPVGPGAGATCPGTASLAPGASCTIVVQFIPTTVGAKTSSLRLGMMPNPSVALSGTGVMASSPFTASPTSLAFGNLMVGSTTGPPMTVTIRNTGTTTASVPPTSIGGTNPLQFVIVTGGAAGTCAATASLAPNATCTVLIRFTPTTLGGKSATLNVGAAPAPVTVALTGTGV